MNHLSHEKNTLCNFHNLLQSRNYQEAWSLLVCKQEVFQSLSKMFVLYNFLDAMWQMQFLLAKVTLKCSYYFVCLLLKVGLSCRSLPGFFLSCFKLFKIKYFGLSHNHSHNLPEAGQQCQLNEALIWGSVLVLSGDCIFAFGDHFVFDSRQKATWNFFNFKPWCR